MLLAMAQAQGLYGVLRIKGIGPAAMRRPILSRSDTVAPRAGEHDDDD